MRKLELIFPMFCECLSDYVAKVDDKDGIDGTVSCGGGHYQNGFVKVGNRLREYINKKGVKLIKV